MPEFSEFVPELVCLGIDCMFLGGLYMGYKSANRHIKELLGAPHINIDEHLQSQIQNHPLSQVSDDGSTTVLKYAVLRGDVAPLGRAVSSSYAPQIVTGVIQKVVFTEHKRNLSKTGFWFDHERVLHKFTNDAPFCLASPEDSIFSLTRPHVEVVDWADAAKIDLDTVYDSYEAAQPGLTSHIWGWVTGDIQKGVQKTEMMLMKGTTLTGVGELVCTVDGVKIQPPTDGTSYYLVRSSFNSLVKEVEGMKSALRVCLWIFGGVGACILGFAAHKYYKKYLIEKTVRRNQESLEEIRAERQRRTAEREEAGEAPAGEANIAEHAQCVVCLGAEREVILLDCGHVCVCADCAGELLRAGHNCPVCRGTIERIMPAYIS